MKFTSANWINGQKYVAELIILLVPGNKYMALNFGIQSFLPGYDI